MALQPEQRKAPADRMRTGRIAEPGDNRRCLHSLHWHASLGACSTEATWGVTACFADSNLLLHASPVLSDRKRPMVSLHPQHLPAAHVKITHSSKLLLWATSVLASGFSRADDAPQGIQALNTVPIVLPTFTISEKTTRRQVYDAKVENLWDAKRKEKTISYVEVLTAAYDTTKFDLGKCLLAKKAYRETIAKDRPFFCNYGAANKQVKINWDSLSNRNIGVMRMRMGAATTKAGVGFSYKTGEITLALEAPLPYLLHASGTALSYYPSKKMAEVLT